MVFGKQLKVNKRGVVINVGAGSKIPTGVSIFNLLFFILLLFFFSENGGETFTVCLFLSFCISVNNF